MMHFMRSVALVMVVIGGTFGELSAQAGQQTPGQGAAALRNQIEQGFRKRVRNELGLNGDLAIRVERIVNSWGVRRTQLEREERGLRAELGGHLRPGVAADEQALNRVVDALNNNRVAQAETFRDEIRELSPLLSPLQRGIYQQMRERFMQNVRNAMQNPQPGDAAAPPRAGPPGGNAPPRQGRGGGKLQRLMP